MKERRRLTQKQLETRALYVRETEQGRVFQVAVCITHRDDDDRILKQKVANLCDPRAKEWLWRLEYWAFTNGHTVEKWPLLEGEDCDIELIDEDVAD